MHLRRVSFLKTTDNAVKMTNKISLRKQKEFRFVKTSVNLRSFKIMNFRKVRKKNTGRDLLELLLAFQFHIVQIIHLISDQFISR